ncbi:MAG: ABC transporter permease [Pseudobdellovibrio sp.]
MKAILTILKKELRGLFFSPLFYFVSFLATLLLGVTYSVSVYNFSQMLSNAMMTMGLGNNQQQNIHYVVFLPHLSLLNLIFIFMVPALAMRMLAEEKKNRTFDLLLTSPVNSVQIVVSKYLALLSVIFGLCILAFIYMVAVSRAFEISWVPVVLATFGIFLVGAVYAALSLFSSSLTENTMISFFIGIVLNLAVWIVGGLSDVVDSPNLKSGLAQISLNMHLQSLVEGVVRVNGLVFFASIIFLFCFLTERIIESTRWRA